MKRVILTIALCLFGVVAFSQPKKLSQSDGNTLLYLESTGIYAISIKNLEGGEDIPIMLYETEEKTIGLFDLMLGILSDIYPDYIGVFQGDGYALMFKVGEGALGFEYDKKLGKLTLDTILKFRGAVEARK